MYKNGTLSVFFELPALERKCEDKSDLVGGKKALRYNCLIITHCSPEAKGKSNIREDDHIRHGERPCQVGARCHLDTESKHVLPSVLLT